MKRTFFYFLTMACGLFASAQDIITTDAVVFDVEEDTTQVVTIKDIIDVQEMVTSRNSTETHFNKVWSRNSFFNIAYNNTTLTPKQDILSGLDDKELVSEFKSDWAVSLTLGHSYRLHKKPIANVLQFNIDYTYINLNLNHFKAKDGDKLYNSDNTWEKVNEENRYGSKDTYHYMPWNLQKYELNYSMALGPSLTIAPFTYLNVPGLHFMKLNVYYHVGYEVSMLMILNDKKRDANNSSNSNYDEMSNSLKMNWGHGLTSTFGFNLSWKAIGVGYETRGANVKYQSIQKDTFGKEWYKFRESNSRVYLTIRY